MGGVPSFIGAFVDQLEAAAGGSPDGIGAYSLVQFSHGSELPLLVLPCDLGQCGPSLFPARSLGPPTWIVIAAPQYGAGAALFVCAVVQYQKGALNANPVCQPPEGSSLSYPA